MVTGSLVLRQTAVYKTSDLEQGKEHSGNRRGDLEDFSSENKRCQATT